MTNSDGFKYYSRSATDSAHLYKYNEKTNEFYWMDHCWTGKGEWVRGDGLPVFEIVEITEERAREISKGTIDSAPHYDN